MISDETALFLAMTVCGAAVSVLYDFMRAVGDAAKSEAAVTAVTDVIFAFASFAAASWCVLNYGNGRLRIYEALGLLLGAVVYFTALSGVMYKVFLCIIKKFLKITIFIFKILLTPLLFLYKILTVPIKKYAESIIQRSRSSNARQNKKSGNKIRNSPQKGTRNRGFRGACRHNAFKRRYAVSETERAKKRNSQLKRSDRV